MCARSHILSHTYMYWYTNANTAIDIHSCGILYAAHKDSPEVYRRSYIMHSYGPSVLPSWTMTCVWVSTSYPCYITRRKGLLNTVFSNPERDTPRHMDPASPPHSHCSAPIPIPPPIPNAHPILPRITHYSRSRGKHLRREKTIPRVVRSSGRYSREQAMRDVTA